jgi:hypothetical protein
MRGGAPAGKMMGAAAVPAPASTTTKSAARAATSSVIVKSTDTVGVKNFMDGAGKGAGAGRIQTCWPSKHHGCESVAALGRKPSNGSIWER